MKLRTSEATWKKIDRILNRSYIPYSDCIEWGIIGIIERISNDVVLIREVLEPDPLKDLDQSLGGLQFSSQYIRRIQLRAQQNKASGLIFFHTHPFAENHVSFSGFDDAEEPLLIQNLQDIWPNSEYGSIVAGRSSLLGRFYSNEGGVLSISRLFVVGRAIKVIQTTGENFSPPTVSQIFDRAKTVTSSGALQILNEMKIAVIGAGGIGSLMIELLDRAGCGKLISIDNDYIDESNLNRVPHASKLDAQEKRKKVHVALSAHHHRNLGGKLEVINMDVTDPSVLERLKDVDMLVGCVDKDTPRYVLNELAVKNYIPYLDLGSEIGIAQDKLQTLDARMTYVYPGGPCLNCRGLIDPERIRLEGLQVEERKRHIQMGYCQDIDIKQPAVMELNMRAASFASLFIRHLIQPFFDQSGEMDFRESLTSLTHKKVSFRKDRDVPCCNVCR